MQQQKLMVKEGSTYRPASSTEIIEVARSFARLGDAEQLDSPESVGRFLSDRIGLLGHEVFACIWLDAQCRVIEYEELFRGTLGQAAVHLREVVKSAMQRNAAAVVLAHNHPSGSCEPSEEDKRLTAALTNALAMVDVAVLDHIVVAAQSYFSLSRGEAFNV